jgi:hypothetical protein
MSDFQDRVVVEKQELDGRIRRLTDFIANSTVYPTLSNEEQVRLNQQHQVMADYSKILGERIAAFGR